MDNVLFGVMDFTNPGAVVGFSLVIVIFLLLDTFLALTLKKWSVVLVCLLLETALVLSATFGIEVLFFVLLTVLLVYMIGLLFCNLGSLRWFFSAPGSKGNGPFGRMKKEKGKPAAIDREAVYEKVKNAVLTLSRQKIGALITFEKRDDLTDLVKNGTIVNAPVSSELLQTIFYPGTRLHDGAVVIRGDKILAASVYFSPTNRPLTGKFGSRHRAAFGICETTDSVTIVVSEETGRISIAYDGDLTGVNPDNFMRIFREDMDDDQKEDDGRDDKEDK